MTAPHSPAPATLAHHLEHIARQVQAADQQLPPMFRPPADNAAIVRAEARLGRTLPASLRTLYGIADGQTEGSATLLDAFSWMPLDEVLDRSEFLNDFFPDGRNEEDPDHAPMDVAPGIKPSWWWPHWLPIMTNGAGDYLCLDLDPAPGGHSGQVIAYYHDETYRLLIAPSIEQLIEVIASGLSSGTYALVDGMIVEV